MSSPLLLLLLTLPLLASSFLLPPSLPPPTFLGAAKFKSFDDMLQTYPQPVLVDFFATWCGPCQLMSKELAAVADDMKDIVKVAKGESEGGARGFCFRSRERWARCAVGIVLACLLVSSCRRREREERETLCWRSRAPLSLSLYSLTPSLSLSLKFLSRHRQISRTGSEAPHRGPAHLHPLQERRARPQNGRVLERGTDQDGDSAVSGGVRREGGERVFGGEASERSGFGAGVPSSVTARQVSL